MNSINSLSVSGRIVSNPTFPRDTIGKTSIALNRSWRNADDAWVEEVSYIDVVCFNGSASLLKKFTKGDFVMVSGSIRQERWTTDGEARSRVVIVASQIQGEKMFTRANDAPIEATILPEDAPEATETIAEVEALRAQLAALEAAKA